MTSTSITDYTLSMDESTTSMTGGGDGGGVHTPWVWSFAWSWSPIVQLIVGCVGIIGNLLVILVMLRQKAYKHTMDIFIGALALADLVTSVFAIPIPAAIQVPDTALGWFYCRWIFSNDSLFIGINASIYTLVGITVQRFIAIVFPLHLERVVTKRRVYAYLVGVWVFAFVNATSVFTIRVTPEFRCFVPLSPSQAKVFALHLLFLRVIVPSITMITAQAFTARVLHRQSAAMRDAGRAGGAGSESPPSFHITARNRVVKLMFIVVCICLVSNAPNNVIMTVLALRGTLIPYLGSPLHKIIRVLASVNFISNPFIYAARYPRFRSAIKDMFTRKGGDKDAPMFDHDATHISFLQTDATSDANLKGLSTSASTSVSTISQKV